MMRFTVLASGSKANATVVEAEGFKILIDCGLSYRELGKRLAVNGMQTSDLNALLITHFHSDHIKGVASLANNVPLEIFARESNECFSSQHWNKIRPSHEIEIGPFRIQPIALPHDDGGSYGFVIQHESQTFVFATDLGEPTHELSSALQDADAAVIEANHDLGMLHECGYPYFLKQRISSTHGHLSNEQSAELLTNSLASRCQHVVLGHLSEHANHPDQALKTIREAVSHSVTAASQSVPTDWFEIIAA